MARHHVWLLNTTDELHHISLASYFDLWRRFIKVVNVQVSVQSTTCNMSWVWCPGQTSYAGCRSSKLNSALQEKIKIKYIKVNKPMWLNTSDWNIWLRVNRSCKSYMIISWVKYSRSCKLYYWPDNQLSWIWRLVGYQRRLNKHHQESTPHQTQ